MTDKDDEKTNAATQALAPADATPVGAMRELLLMRAGPHALAVFAGETDGAVPLTRPTPLPFAPPAVLGVVAVRGRMRTVIDPLPLLDNATTSPPTEGETQRDRPPQAVLLRGDEQLALAVSEVGATIEIKTGDILPPEAPHDFARGTITHEGSPLLILDPAKLFDAATRGMERRRRRR